MGSVHIAECHQSDMTVQLSRRSNHQCLVHQDESGAISGFLKKSGFGDIANFDVAIFSKTWESCNSQLSSIAN